jgi:hypothetical protein
MQAPPGVSPAAPAADSLRPMRPALAFNFYNALNWQVAIGSPMVLLVESLGGSTFHVGLCFAFIYLMAPIQVLATSLLPQFGFKRLMMSGWGLRALFLLPCIGIAYLARGGHRAPWMVLAMVGSVFAFTFFRAFGSGAWLPWLYRLLPEAGRGKYFATEQLVTGVGGVVILITCAALFRWLPLHDAFMVEYSIAFVGAILSYLALGRMADTEKPVTSDLAGVVRETPGICLRPGVFRAFLLVACVFAFATTAIAPLGIYYLRVESSVSPGDILFYTMMQYAGTAVVSLFTRNEIDRRGPRPFFYTAALVIGVVVAFWIALLTLGFQGRSFFPAACFGLGAGAGLWAAAYQKYLPVLVPPENRTLILAIYGAVTAFAGGLAPVVWGLIVRGVGHGMNLPAFTAFFLFVLACMIGIVLRMRRFAFPAAATARPDLGEVIRRPHQVVTYFITLVDSSIGPAGGEPGATPKL